MNPEKYLILGSGPLALQWYAENERHLSSWAVCPLNTAWKIVGPERIHLWFHSKDFTFREPHVPSDKQLLDLRRKALDDCVLSPFTYISGDEDKCGTMALNAMAHVLNLATAAGKKIVTAVACSNFIYGPGKTHWYGRGIDVEVYGRPDPMRSGVHNLLAWLRRTKDTYEKAGCSIFNVGPFTEGTLLPFTQAEVATL